MKKKLLILAVALTIFFILGNIATIPKNQLFGAFYGGPNTAFSYSFCGDVGWWNDSWLYRKEITIDHTKVAGDLDYFPVLISISGDADLAAHAHSDGDDICFIDSCNLNKYNHEIEHYDIAGGIPPTTTLIAWVNVTHLLRTSDTILYMYYGNADCSNQENINGTWDSHYKMVQHMNETTGSTLEDSTSNNNDGIKAGNAAQTSSGKIDGAYIFDGDGDYVNISDTGTSLDFIATQSYTFSLWVKSNQVGICGTFSKGGQDSDTGYTLYPDTPADHETIFGPNVYTDSVPVEGPTVAQSTWTYITVTYRNEYITMYIDGALYSSGTWSGFHDNTTGPFLLGYGNNELEPGDSTYFDGTIDEVRISDIARSAAWINATFLSMNAPNSFYSLGSEVHTNYAPELSNPDPEDEGYSTHTNPDLVITVKDDEGQTMDMTIRTNASGSWTTLQTFNAIANGTYHTTPTTMSSYATQYWWSVNCTDTDLWTNETYSFTTPSIVTKYGVGNDGYITGGSRISLCCSTIYFQHV